MLIQPRIKAARISEAGACLASGMEMKWTSGMARSPRPGGRGRDDLEKGGGGARGHLRRSQAAEPGRVGTYPRRPLPCYDGPSVAGSRPPTGM